MTKSTKTKESANVKPLKVNAVPLKVNAKPLKVNAKPLKVNAKPLKVNAVPLKVSVKPIGVSEKRTKPTEPIKANESTKKLLVAADLARDTRTIAVEKQTRDVFTEERATDPIDVSSQTETKMLYASISAVVNRLKPQYHNDFDGVHCLDCGDKMPMQRLLDRRIRCTPCEEVVENKGKMRA